MRKVQRGPMESWPEYQLSRLRVKASSLDKEQLLGKELTVEFQAKRFLNTAFEFPQATEEGPCWMHDAFIRDPRTVTS